MTAPTPAHADKPNRLRRQLLAAPLLMSLTAPAGALDGAIGARNVALNAALRALLDDPKQPLASLAVAVLRQGRLVHQAHFGRRTIDAHDAALDLPVTADTLFRMASISKLVVALGVMRMVESGRLDLDADISATLGFELRHPRHPSAPITLRLLLSHRAGLSDAGGAYLSAGQTVASRLLPGGAHYGDGAVWGAQAPGEFFEYCNLAYGVVASVMERASGERFDRLMQRLVLRPLAMAGGFEASNFSAAEIAQLATLYRKSSDEIHWNSAGPWIAQTDALHGRRPAPPAGIDDYVLGSNGSLFGPQGRLHTRLQDLARVAALLLAEGRHHGEIFLKPASIRMLFSEQWRFDSVQGNGDSLDGMFQAWGLGVQHFIDRREPPGASHGDRLIEPGGQQAWGHLGFAYGLVAGLLVDPASGNGIVYVIGGTGADPEVNPGRYSSFPIWEERLQNLLWMHARAG